MLNILYRHVTIHVDHAPMWVMHTFVQVQCLPAAHQSTICMKHNNYDRLEFKSKLGNVATLATNVPLSYEMLYYSYKKLDWKLNVSIMI